jgi:hypothetical protein
MKILFLSYWGIDEGLTKATVLPHILILENLKSVDEVWLSTIERNDFFEVQNVKHIPLISRLRLFRFLNKIYDFFFFPILLSRLIRKKKIDFLICRGAPAGAIGHKVHLKTGIPYAVESFEPHAEYMLESGVWAKDSLSYRLENKWENEQIESANYIITVSESYRRELFAIYGDNQKFKLAPCAVESSKFHFQKKSRNEIRKLLGINMHDFAGIYVGKFGGLYLEEESFHTMEKFLLSSEKRVIIILTPLEKEQVLVNFNSEALKGNRIHVLSVDHDQVPSFLSAADVAFAFYKPSNSKKALSPIKIGEYWASGLPVLIPAGIGDDSDIIFQNQIGSELKLEDIEGSVSRIIELVKSKKRIEWAKEIMPFAEKYRSFERIKEVYSEILEKFD